MTYLVTGATGTVGGWVVHHLLEAGHPVRVLTRDATRAGFPQDVEVFEGTMDDVETLRPAFADVRAAHLIAFGSGETPLHNGKQIVAAMGEAGIERCTVLANWDEGTLQPALTAAAFPWTHLRPVEFMSNKIGDWARAIRTEGIVREIGDTAGPLVHPADIGAVAAAGLTSEEHAGQDYLITGPESLRPSEQLAILAEVLDRDLEYVAMTPERGMEHFRSLGMPEELVQMKAYLADPAGLPPEVRQPQPIVEQVTGRPARPFRQWAEENKGEFL